MRECVHPSMCASVNTFKHEYLCSESADWNEILSEASLGERLREVLVQIRSELVSMATDSSHRILMGKMASSRFLENF